MQTLKVIFQALIHLLWHKKQLKKTTHNVQPPSGVAGLFQTHIFANDLDENVIALRRIFKGLDWNTENKKPEWKLSLNQVNNMAKSPRI